jgi:hypothetical protein
MGGRFDNVAGVIAMARGPKLYSRLPGRPVTGFGVKMLWQGPDHLLWVERSLGQETYKRFYYKDIQAVTMRRTRRHHLWNGLWGTFALLFGLIVIGASGPAYFSTFMATLFAALLIVNLILGPACRVHLQTAVQIHPVSSLRRVRTARKAMRRIKALVEAEQGRLEPNDLRLPDTTMEARHVPSAGGFNIAD